MIKKNNNNNDNNKYKMTSYSSLIFLYNKGVC